MQHYFKVALIVLVTIAVATRIAPIKAIVFA
jgi:hypothetical protein